MPNQTQEQHFEYIIIKDSISIADTLAVTEVRDSVYNFYQPEVLSASDSVYQSLINPVAIKTIPQGEYGFIPKPKSQYISDWTTATILLLFVLLATIRTTSGGYVIQLFQSLFNKRIANRLYREKTSTLFNTTFLLDTFFAIVTGIYIFQVVDHFSQFENLEGLIYCGLTVVAFTLYITLKISLYRITGFIFDISFETDEFLFHSKTGNRIIGIIMFPLVLFMFISKGDLLEIFLFSGVVILAIFNVFNTLRVIIIIAQKVFPVYYLILYLCTLEILPLLLGWKILERM